jgi:hypothetical protein
MYRATAMIVAVHGRESCRLLVERCTGIALSHACPEPVLAKLHTHTNRCLSERLSLWFYFVAALLL